ncbi:MAG: radical SAM protein [Lachnospiraceae bacterium]|nr:radical SAM protein [Lachnospiraceae bacterium]
MYYKLRENICLRGWDRLPWALVIRPENRVHFLKDKDEFRALELCNGRINCDGVLVPPRVREFIRTNEEKGFVEACAYGDSITEDQEYRRYENRFIWTAHWSITGKCNYRCRHCYMSAPEGKLGELSHESVMDILSQLDECGVTRIALTGGEPLIREDWWELIDEIVRRRMYLTQIYTNGALVNGRLLRGLKERGLCPKFIMSYDGDDGWHDWMRGVKGAGSAVLRVFDLCYAHGFPTGAEMCLHKGNLHLLRQSVRTLAAHHCEILKVSPVSETEFWKRYGEGQSVSMEEVNAAYLEYIPMFFEDGMPLSLVLGGAFECGKGSADWEIPMEKYDGSDGCLRQSICGHARQTLYISPEGRMLPCMPLTATDIQHEYPLISEIGLRQGLTDSTYMKLINLRVDEFLHLVPKCGDCSYAKVCAGGCRASALLFGEPHSLMAPDEDCCDLFLNGWADKIRSVASRSAAAVRSDAASSCV